MNGNKWKLRKTHENIRKETKTHKKMRKHTKTHKTDENWRKHSKHTKSSESTKKNTKHTTTNERRGKHTKHTIHMKTQGNTRKHKNTHENWQNTRQHTKTMCWKCVRDLFTTFITCFIKTSENWQKSNYFFGNFFARSEKKILILCPLVEMPQKNRSLKASFWEANKRSSYLTNHCCNAHEFWKWEALSKKTELPKLIASFNCCDCCYVIAFPTRIHFS